MIFDQRMIPYSLNNKFLINYILNIPFYQRKKNMLAERNELSNPVFIPFEHVEVFWFHHVYKNVGQERKIHLLYIKFFSPDFKYIFCMLCNWMTHYFLKRCIFGCTPIKCKLLPLCLKYQKCYNFKLFKPYHLHNLYFSIQTGIIYLSKPYYFFSRCMKLLVFLYILMY